MSEIIIFSSLEVLLGWLVIYTPFPPCVVGVSALIIGYITTKFLKNVDHYQFVPTKMQKAMFWGSAGLGLAFGGLSMILKTVSEYSKSKYFSWCS